MIKRYLCLCLGVLVTFFLDAQITYFLSLVSHHQWFFNSHLLLFFLFYMGLLSESPLFWLYLALVGLCYDRYYLLTLGPVTCLFPLLMILIQVNAGWLKLGGLLRQLALFLLVILFEVSLYSLVWEMGLTRFPMGAFLTAQLLPTSLLTLLEIALFFRILDRFFIKDSFIRQISTEL